MNYKYSDITSKVVLALLVIFYIWIGFQWDENAPKKQRRPRPKSNTETADNSKKEAEKEKEASVALVFRTDPYFSGFDGRVTLNGRSVDATFISSGNSASFSNTQTIVTDKDSWISIEYASGFMMILSSSNVHISNKTIDVRSGTVYISGQTLQTELKAKGIPIYRGSSTVQGNANGSIATETTILVERNKVRIFCLKDQVAFRAFGKNYALTSGIGTSLFFDAKKVNQYDLGEAIVAISQGNGVYSWEPKNDPIRYNVILKGVNSSNPQRAEYIRKLVQTQTTSVTENQLKQVDTPKIFTENRFFTWSRGL